MATTLRLAVFWAALALGWACCPSDDIYLMVQRRCAKHPDVSLINCTGNDGHYILDPSLRPEDVFSVAPDGSLRALGANDDADTLHANEGEFCVTHVLYEDETLSARPVAFVCFPTHTQLSGGAFGTRLVLYAGLLLLSAVFLAVTFVLYAMLPGLRDLQGRCVMGAVLSLCLANVWLAVVQLTSSEWEHKTCKAQAYILYFWMLSSFFWLNVVAFNVWKCVVGGRPSPQSEGRRFAIYVIYAVGTPLVFLLVAVITEHVPGEHVRPNFGISKCWFDGRTELWSYFYGPVAVLITCNIVFFLWTAWRLWRDYKDQSTTRLRSLRFKCLLYLKLFLVMGITWIFELLSDIVGGTTGFWIVTDVLNCLQGVIIFVVVICRKRVLKAIVSQRPCGLSYPKQWAAGVDEESEAMLDEEAELSQGSPVCT